MEQILVCLSKITSDSKKDIKNEADAAVATSAAAGTLEYSLMTEAGHAE